MKRCKDCIWWISSKLTGNKPNCWYPYPAANCIANGRTEYECKWWKFWREK